MRATEHPMHPSYEAIASVVSFSAAGLSTGTLWIAQAVESVPPQARGWMELGGTIGLIGGLSYGCVTLWKEVQNQKRDMADLNKEIREDWKKQNDKLITVLEKLDPDEK
jgi:hypothetical protein